MKFVEIPWRAWYGDEVKELSFPDRAEIKMIEIPYRSPLEEGTYKKKFEELPSLFKKRDCKKIIIVVDDLTRPVKLETLMNVLLTILKENGFGNTEVKILVGVGGHRPLEDKDLKKKIGSHCVDNYSYFNHSPFKGLVKLPVEWKGSPVEINRHFVEADFRIVISGLTPHSFAGFSGGAKMLIPGISNLEVIKRTHKSVLMGFMGKLGNVENNRFRREIEAIAKQIGVDYFIGLMANANRDVVAVHCGDIIEAYGSAAKEALEYYTMDVKSGEFDVILLNAYPKDTELLQAENAFHPLQSSTKALVRDGGMVIVADACSEKMGYHELFGTNKALYRTPMPKRFLNPYDVVYYLDNVTEDDFRQVFWNGYKFYDQWKTVYEYIEKKFPNNFRVVVFPSASMQLVN
jgi:nickel-dependent lactate racemase